MNGYRPGDSGKLSDTEDQDLEPRSAVNSDDPGSVEISSGLDDPRPVTAGESIASFLKELPALIITAVVIAFVIKWFIIQPFYIPSQSMEPTLIPEDRVLVSKFIYRFVPPKAGDVVVFVAPNEDGRDFIKRIVATEGDVVQVIEGELFINDKPAKQDFETMPGDYSNWGPTEIQKNHVFVMGDNRPNSLDGRIFGQLPKENILGKAFMIYWPINRVKIIN